MDTFDEVKLSRREREILDIVYSVGEATATDVLNEMVDPPSRTSVRTILRILEEKGHLSHGKTGREYVYRPTRPRKSVGRSALRRVLEVFFEDSVEKALANHLSDPSARIDDAELARLEKLIGEAKRKGR